MKEKVSTKKALWPATVAIILGMFTMPACRQEADISQQERDNQQLLSAQFEVGMLLLLGKGVPQDEKMALYWFQEAADQGDASAQVMVGNMYSRGQGAPKDDKEALRWFQKAADQGDAGAQFMMGSMLLGNDLARSLGLRNGQGVPKDDKEALRWFQKAADQGFATAQFTVGNMYILGQGVPPDLVRAYMWYDLAASAKGESTSEVLGISPESLDDLVGPRIFNSAMITERRDFIAVRMTPEQIVKAQRLAREWKPNSSGQEVFANRAIWKEFPQPFLEALAEKFRLAEAASSFALFCEESGILENDIRRLSEHGDPQLALGAVAVALTRYGNKMAMQIELIKAKEALELALVLNPNHVETWLYMAIVSKFLGDCTSAVKWADKSLDFQPDPNSGDSWDKTIIKTQMEPIKADCK